MTAANPLEAAGGGVTAEPPPPSLTKTYRWADGEPVFGEYSWMDTDDGFQDSVDDGWEPRWVLVETWERASVEVVMLYPTGGWCGIEDTAGEPCEADAVTWVQEGDTWRPLCQEHRHTLTPVKP